MSDYTNHNERCPHSSPNGIGMIGRYEVVSDYENGQRTVLHFAEEWRARDWARQLHALSPFLVSSVVRTCPVATSS